MEGLFGRRDARSKMMLIYTTKSQRTSIRAYLMKSFLILIFHLEQDGEEKIPEPPSSDVAQGILPRLIATLVSRRRQVKALMKDKSATPDKIIQVRVYFFI